MSTGYVVDHKACERCAAKKATQHLDYGPRESGRWHACALCKKKLAQYYEHRGTECAKRRQHQLVQAREGDVVYELCLDCSVPGKLAAAENRRWGKAA